MPNILIRRAAPLAAAAVLALSAAGCAGIGGGGNKEQICTDAQKTMTDFGSQSIQYASDINKLNQAYKDLGSKLKGYADQADDAELKTALNGLSTTFSEFKLDTSNPQAAQGAVQDLMSKLSDGGQKLAAACK